GAPRGARPAALAGAPGTTSGDGPPRGGRRRRPRPSWSALQRRADARDAFASLGPRQGQRAMVLATNRLGPPRIVGQARDQMPVDVRDLIAEELVVHLVSVEDAGQCLRHPGDLLHERAARSVGASANSSVAWRFSTSTVQPGKN